MEKLVLIGISVFFAFILLANLLNLGGGDKGAKDTKPEAKPKAKKQTDTTCFNGICKTLAVLEAEIDEFVDKYPDSKHTTKLKRKIKALV